MFSKRGFPFGIVFLCIIALGLGFLSGYAGSLIFHNTQVASEPASTPEPILSQATLEPVPTPQPTLIPTPEELPANAGAEVTDPPEPAKTPRLAGYLIQEYTGKIAVYRVMDDGESELSSLLDVDVESLPKADRENLKKGIGVGSEEEMLQLLEDYMS